MFLKMDDSSTKYFFIFWFPVEGWNINKSGTLNGILRLYIVILHSFVRNRKKVLVLTDEDGPNLFFKMFYLTRKAVLFH